jgi:soluble lytic murein transglycosylase
MIVLSSLLLGLGGATAALHAQGAAVVTPDSAANNSELGAPVMMAPIRSEGDPAAPVMMAPVRSAGDPPAPDGTAPAENIALGEPVLSANDRSLFVAAHNAADRNDWTNARSYADAGVDPIAKRMVRWRWVLDEEGGATFQDIADFLYQSPNWPRRDALLARAEKLMPPEYTAAQVIAWFGMRQPVSREGKMRLGQALISVGRQDEGAALVRDAWIANNYSLAEETQILQQFGHLLREEDHRARLDRFLATEGIVDAQRQLTRVDPQSQRVGDARLRLKVNPTIAASLPSMFDSTVLNDPRLIYDYARAMRRAGRDDEAWSNMLRIGKSDLIAPQQMWAERHIMARDALKVRRYDIAYQLVSTHGLTSGAGFADAEFLSGWIALRFLNKPDAALNHFRALAGGVSMPISRSRAHYWTGRAHEALGQVAEAEAAYRRAAADSTTYYGQLAVTRIQAPAVLQVTGTLPDTTSVLPAFENDDRVRAMRIAADLGLKTILRIFAFHIANDTENSGYFSLLADMMSRYGDRQAALRIAKMASYKDVLLVPHFVPLVPVPPPPGSASVERALVLGLTRQESEFDPWAVSSANARGLMQLIPGTASRTARSYGLPYRQAALTSDPEYNMKLGQAHLNDLLRQWSGSYILTIASYNAGAGNARNWIETFGDPRDPGVDPIDWVELIPFGETRNYVQRVLENTQVYRNRLAGSDQRLTLVSDLHRPNAAPPVALVSNIGTAANAPASQPSPQ